MPLHLHMLGIQLRSKCFHGKHFAEWTISLTRGKKKKTKNLKNCKCINAELLHSRCGSHCSYFPVWPPAGSLSFIHPTSLSFPSPHHWDKHTKVYFSVRRTQETDHIGRRSGAQPLVLCLLEFPEQSCSLIKLPLEHLSLCVVRRRYWRKQRSLCLSYGPSLCYG